MRLKVKYIYSDTKNLKENIVFVDADIDENTPNNEIDNTLKPLIAKQTGHFNIKIINCSEVF